MYDIVLHRGLTYADAVSVNFTLVVDPRETRPPGTAAEAAVAVLVPLCHVKTADPAVAPTDPDRVCGEAEAVEVWLKEAGKEGSLGWGGEKGFCHNHGRTIRGELLRVFNIITTSLLSLISLVRRVRR